MFKSWKKMKPVEKKFWKWFWIIKGAMVVIIIILFVVFVMKFKENLWN